MDYVNYSTFNVYALAKYVPNLIRILLLELKLVPPTPIIPLVTTFSRFVIDAPIPP
jgi:hypothetical protein